jgi:hypothetical protein
MPLFLWMSRRSSGMHQRTPNSWAIWPPRSSVRENRKTHFQLRAGFCVLGDRLLRDAHERRPPRLDRRPERLERLQVPAACRAPQAGVEGKEQRAMPEHRFRRNLDAALVPQSKGRRAVARLERALGLSCHDQVFGRASHRIRSVALAWLRRRRGSRPQACSRFFSCPVFRQPAVVSDPGEFWFTLVESSSRRR